MEALANELNFLLSTTYSLVLPCDRVVRELEEGPLEELKELRKLLLVDIQEGIEAASCVQIETCPLKENQLVIDSDLSVPVCCGISNSRQDARVAENYLETPLAEIRKKKEQIDFCSKCMQLGIPQYGMVFNRKRWEEIAESKETTDK